VRAARALLPRRYLRGQELCRDGALPLAPAIRRVGLEVEIGVHVDLLVLVLSGEGHARIEGDRSRSRVSAGLTTTLSAGGGVRFQRTAHFVGAVGRGASTQNYAELSRIATRAIVE
jgi:hypothetical protein